MPSEQIDPPAEEIGVKEARVREYMLSHGLDAALLSRQDNFSWFTCGGNSHVSIASETGVASLLITPDRKCVVATNIEAGRIADEEVADQGFEIFSHPWHDEAEKQELIKRLVGDGKAAADHASAGLPMLATDFAELRYSLTPQEIERYRALGADCGEIIARVARTIEPGDTENLIAAWLARECLERGIIPTIFTDKPIEKYAMVVLCGKRRGLVCSATRLVHFGPVSEDLAAKHSAVVGVDVVLIQATKVGAPVGEIFDAGLNAYKQLGFPEEWQLHHQGGPTGYASRDYKATPGETRCVQANQAFAWNPSITGAKSEDTIIALETGPEIISASPDWPTIEAAWQGETVLRPDILVK